MVISCYSAFLVGNGKRLCHFKNGCKNHIDERRRPSIAFNWNASPSRAASRLSGGWLGAH